jgi:hypothetical protein
MHLCHLRFTSIPIVIAISFFICINWDLPVNAQTPSSVNFLTYQNPTERYSIQYPSVFGVLSAGVGAVWLEIGIGYIIMSYGLFKSKGWAWTITLVLSIISIAISIIFGITGGVLNLSSANTMNGSNSLVSGIIVTIIGIAVDIVIIYYLCRPHVKAFFGKTVPYKI